MDREKLDLFWSKVNKSGPVPHHMPHLGQCWVWEGTKNRLGYGYTKVRSVFGKSCIAAHRVSAHIAGHQIVGATVLHRCDNPSCVRPDHLTIGAQRDNVADMIAKGRGRWPGPRQRGSSHPKAKLTEADVVRIRDLYRNGIGSYRLGKMFGVAKQTILGILRGKTWKEVP